MKRGPLGTALWPLLWAGAVDAASYEHGVSLKQQQQLGAAAAEFRALLDKDANDIRSLEQLAIVESWLQHYEVAIGHWHRLIEMQPESSYFQLGLARVQYWKGEAQLALSTLEHAATLGPQSTDALVLRGDVLLALGRRGEARASYEAARATPEGRVDDALAAKLARSAPERRWRLDAGAIFDRFDAQRGNEDSQYAQIGYAFAPQLTGYLHYDRYHQFDSRDHGVAVGSYWSPGKQWLLQAEIALNVDEENFRPSRQYSASLEWLIELPVQPLLGLRLATYGEGDVTTLTPGLRFLPPGPVALELRHAFSDNTDGSHTGVTSLRANASLGRYAPYLLYVKGQEALPPLDRAHIAVTGAGVVVEIDARWSLRLDYSYEDREGAYIHQAYGLGASLRF